MDKFLLENNTNEINYHREDENSLLICSYNVNGWTYPSKFIQIIKLLSQCSFDILILQEVSIYHNLTIKDIISEMRKYGYIDFLTTPNGESGKDKFRKFVIIFGRKKFTIKNVIDATIGEIIRHIPLIEYSNIKIAGVHLEIGQRYYFLPEDSLDQKRIVERNIKMRINQLELILKHNPDIIMGDFNFTPNDSEFKWLLTKGYKFVGNKDLTNPYNRCDLIFINRRLKEIHDEIIKTNASDHLPILCELRIVF